MANRIKVGSHTIELSNTEKALFPEDGITKGDLIEYYRQVADIMLPYLQDRPLTLFRYPDGINHQVLVQQEISENYPDWIDRVSVKKREGGSIDHVLCQNASTLVYLANQACITLHVWLSRKDSLEYPDQLIFDLDPSGKDFNRVRESALLLRKFLNDLGLESWVKTSGSRGLHVIIPLDRQADFNQVHRFAHDVAEILSKREPEKLTIEARKEKRKDRIFLDFVRNSYGQTVVAPYSVRAIPGAPVAAPLDWDEISEPDLGPQSFTIKNVLGRLSRKKDPWEGIWHKTCSLDKAQKNLNLLKKAGDK
jgi:bifunctional non-homologous end joining protein LigD